MHQRTPFLPTGILTRDLGGRFPRGHALGDLRSLDQRVYDALRTDILAGRLRPGAPLRVPQLARQLEVGSTTVRRALDRLANEGLVTIYPRRGTHVTRITPHDAQDIFAVRLLLEPPVAAQVAADLPDGLIARLRALCDDMATQAEALSEIEPALDIEFHLAILEVTGNRYLCDLYRFFDVMFTTRIPHWQQDPRVAAHATVAEHRVIVEALAARDPEAASYAAAAHLAAARERLLRRLQERPGEEQEPGHEDTAHHPRKEAVMLLSRYGEQKGGEGARTNGDDT